MNTFHLFFKAISNEASIDKDLLFRLGEEDRGFVPIRPLKSRFFIEKYKIRGSHYVLISFCFLVISPVYFLALFFKRLKRKKVFLEVESDHDKSLVLIANSRTVPLFKKSGIDEVVTYLNVNQNTNTYTHVYSLLSWLEQLKAYVCAVLAVWYVIIKLKDKTDVLQTYVAYDWFLVYFGVDKIKNRFHKVYFSNHYDRWAVMFDALLCEQEVILFQHGVLPERLELSYKLAHIKTIYALDQKSINSFLSLFQSKDVDFKKLDSTLKLTEIESEGKTILIIGQPHSMVDELKIVEQLKTIEMLDIYIKPHPLFSTVEYEALTGVSLVEGKEFYPRVDVALSYESTLGVEYESSGVPVVWWKGMSVDKVMSEVTRLIR